ncbi:hypothetical protein [Beijerinckia sp. L45]|nr:hypothetical protein [Beijerinckia sp. L45]
MNKYAVAVLATFAITVGVVCKGIVVSGQTIRALFGRGERP